MCSNECLLTGVEAAHADQDQPSLIENRSLVFQREQVFVPEAQEVRQRHPEEKPAWRGLRGVKVATCVKPHQPKGRFAGCPDSRHDSHHRAVVADESQGR